MKNQLARAFLLFLFTLSTIVTVSAQTSLTFVHPSEIPIQDSIPGTAGERILLYYKGVDGSLQAHWVVFLINVPYEQTRVELRELVLKDFGIDSENELTAFVQAGRSFSKGIPKVPLFGVGFTDFQIIRTQIKEGREYQIQSNAYNKSGTNNFSKSVWRVIDGNRLFTKTCSLVVVSRTDRSREWAIMHPGIPLPFKESVDTKLVTDKEIKVLEDLRQKNEQSKARYFVPNTVYETNCVIETMTAIRDFANEM